MPPGGWAVPLLQGPNYRPFFCSKITGIGPGERGCLLSSKPADPFEPVCDPSSAPGWLRLNSFFKSSGSNLTHIEIPWRAGDQNLRGWTRTQEFACVTITPGDASGRSAPRELWLSNHRLVTQAVPETPWGQLLTGVDQAPDCLNQNLGVRQPAVSVF